MDSTSDRETNHGNAIIGESPILEKQIIVSRVADEEVLRATLDKPIETCTVKAKPKVDFSIEAILSSRTTTSSTIVVNSSEIFGSQSKTYSIKNQNDQQFSWVYCTRYRPPKLPRVKREINLRNRYRNPRIPFSTTEVNALERKFLQSPYLGSNDVNELAAALNMSPKRVKIWFQNRRARERREREVQ